MAVVSYRPILTFDCRIADVDALHFFLMPHSFRHELTVVFTSEKTRDAVAAVFKDRLREESLIPGLDYKRCCVFNIYHPQNFYDQSVGDPILPLLKEISQSVSPEAKAKEICLRVVQPAAHVASDSIYSCQIEGLKEIHLAIDGGDHSSFTLVFACKKTRDLVARVFDQEFSVREMRCNPKKDLSLERLPQACDEECCYVLDLHRWKDDPSTPLGNQIQAVLDRIGNAFAPKAALQKLVLQMNLFKL